jgi:DNA-binding NtrC family response regulator
MIVDDETAILEKVKSFLAEDDFNVVTANNSRQALEILEKEENIDLILINTPISSDNTTALYSMKPNSKLVSSETESFLQKPFTKQQLISFIKNKI